MNLYIWDEVLWDYTPGIMFAVAPSVEEARRMLIAANGFHHADMDKEPSVHPVTEPICRVVYGGG
jgi:hypothetical protein